MSKTLSKDSGQSLLISVLILVFLLASIPAIIFLLQTTTKHSVMSLTRKYARDLAGQGVSYAMQQLSSAFILPGDGGPPPSCPAPPSYRSYIVNTGRYTVTNGSYTISCAPPLSPPDYAATVLSEGYFQDASSKVQAIVSPLTLGILWPNNTGVSAALQLKIPPAGSGILDVNWGPVAVTDAVTPWTVSGNMDTQRYPRKFCKTAIIGGVPRSCTAYDPTDNKEYWCNVSFEAGPSIDLPTYKSWAIGTSSVYSPVLYTGGASSVPSVPSSPCSSSDWLCPGWSLTHPIVQGNGYYNTGGGGAVYVFDANPYAGGSDYILPPAALASTGHPVIYVDGNVEFQNAALDFGRTGGGAVIIVGDLTLGNKSAASGLSLNSVYVSATAPVEYPFDASWPCAGSQGTTCDPGWSGSDQPIMLGFLYVTGNLTILPGSNVRILGAVRVDGQLTIGAGATFHVNYDDEVNHWIRTTQMQLQIDSLKEISAD